MSIESSHGPFPSDETLAAFVDGRLDRETRQKVVEHVADCTDCRDVVVFDQRFAESERGGNVRPFRKRQAILLAVAAAVVAVIALAVIRVVIRDRENAGIAALAAAAPPYRAFEGRVAAMPYKPIRPTYRGGESNADDSQNWRAISVAETLRKEADTHPTAANLHALGVGYLLLGNAREAVPVLERALLAEQKVASVADAVSTTRDDELLNDISAAYLARSESDHIASDRLSALNCAERSWALRHSAPAAWNRAVAATKLRLADRAATAWKDYRSLDTTSPWADEARTRQQQPVSQLRDWQQWRSSVVKGDADAREQGIRAFARESRLLLEDDLLPAWGSAVKRGDDSAAAATLVKVSAIATAFFDVTGDRLPLDTVDAINRSGTSRGLLAGAHEAYGEGRAKYLAGDATGADALFVSASKDLKDARSPFATAALVARSSCRFYMEDHPTSLRLASEASAEACAHSYTAVCANAEWLNGLNSITSADYATALTHYRVARDQFRVAKDDYGVAAVDGLIAEALEDLGDENGAQELRLNALAILNMSAPHRGAIIAEVGRYALRIHDDDAAIAIAAEMLSQSRALVNDGYRVEAVALRSAALAQQGRRVEAEAERRQALQLAGSIKDAPRRERAICVVEACFPRTAAGAPSDLWSLGRAIVAVRSSGRHLELSDLYERRAEILLGHDRVREARNDLQSALQELAVSYKAIGDTHFRSTYTSRSGTIFTAMAGLRLKEGDVAGATAYLEMRRAAESDFTWDLRNPQVPQYASIPEHDAVLDLEMTRGSLTAFVLTRRGIQRVPIGSEVAVDRSLERIRKSFLTPDRAAQDEALAAAYEVILRPLAPLLEESRTLVVVADDDLSDIPLPALRDARRGRYVVDDFRIAMANTMSRGIAYLAHPRRPLRTSRALVVGDPAFDPAVFPLLPRLPGARTEAAAVAPLYSNASLLLDRYATKEQVLAGLGDADVLHFAGHAILDPTRDVASFLVCAGRGALHAGEILSQRRVPELVVLAGCESLTGRGNGRAWRNPISAAFLHAGASAVVGAITDTVDGPSAAMLAAVHRGYLATGDAVAALQQAQVAASRAKAALPVQWGTYRVDI